MKNIGRRDFLKTAAAAATSCAPSPIRCCANGAAGSRDCR
ncbi:MAG: twin-arginine translocation signal domain-containing protein [Opitutales bacterium]|nr:twin-arginine translocation signal domain-containing protein [Opitutales bacterium]